MIFLIEICNKIVVGSHAVVRNNMKRPCELFSHFTPMATFCRTTVMSQVTILTLRQPSDRVQISPVLLADVCVCVCVCVQFCTVFLPGEVCV